MHALLLWHAASGTARADGTGSVSVGEVQAQVMNRQHGCGQPGELDFRIAMGSCRFVETCTPCPLPILVASLRGLSKPAVRRGPLFAPERENPFSTRDSLSWQRTSMLLAAMTARTPRCLRGLTYNLG